MARTQLVERVAVINVPSKVGARAWRECWQLTANRSGVFGVNETFLRSMKVLWLSLAAARGWASYGVRSGPNPVFWNRRRWKKVSATRVELHGRGPRYSEWPGFNDARYATVVVLRRRRRKGQPPVPLHAFICTHWVAWANEAPLRWRQQVRQTAIDECRALVKQGLDKGMVVWFMGDTNVGGHVHVAPAGSNFHWLREDGIDKIGVGLPAGTRLVESGVDVYSAPTDHDHGIAARVVLSVVVPAS